MPGGRPFYQPTDAERVMVRNMAAAGLSQQTIQLCLPKAPKHPKTFVKAFREELTTSGPMVTARAMSKLVVALDKGEAWAICFWLKCKAGFEERTAHRVVDKEGEDRDVRVIVEYVDVPPKTPTPASSASDGTR